MPSPAGNNISVQLKDAFGTQTVATAYATFGATDTVAGITTALQTWLNLLNNVTGCQIVQARYELLIAPTGAAAARVAALADTNADIGVGVSFPKADNKQPWTFFIPGVQSNIIVSGVPNQADGSTLDLLQDVMENVDGSTPMAGSTGGFFWSSGQSPLKPTGYARRATHKHRKSTGKKAPGA